MAGFLTLLAIEGFVIYGIPRLSTRLFLDFFWGSLEFLIMGFVLFSVSWRSGLADYSP
jgi:hypothetical protein